MKNRISNIITHSIGGGLLAVATFVSVEQEIFAADPPPDPAHAAHVAAGAMPSTTAKGDPALSQQIYQLRAKVAQLEAALAKTAPQMTAAPAGAAMPGIPGATASATPAMSSIGMGKMKPGGMAGMGGGATPAPPMAGMSGGAAPASSMNMMGMMDKMMGMMDKMMGMGGAPMPAGGMGMDMMEMGAMPGGGAMPAKTPAVGMANMSGSGMMGMMDMGGGASMAAMPHSALPGFPGASHLYHLGATGFFLDHPQHIALTTQQQAALNQAKEQALLAKSTADRAVEQAEQELWTLTAADQPDAAKIEAKIREIEKLRGDERLAFIRAVGEASNLLDDEQRKILTGFAPPVPASAMTGGMKDM